MTDSDALTIARWCWPDRKWSGDTIARTSKRLPETMDAHWMTVKWDHVHAAERVLIERGLAEEYGRELIRVLFGEDEFGNPGLPLTPMSYATIAAATLDVRVLAMMNVILAQKPSGIERA